MNDIDIRKVLLATLQEKYKLNPQVLIVEELGLCQGEVRLDIAVINVNGRVHGYEIKSERDTLKRLSRQQDIYSKIFDSLTLVASGNHLKKAKEIVPRWWGLSQADFSSGEVSIHQVRAAKKNKKPDPFSLVQLLWKTEALSLLKKHKLESGILSKPREVLWERLAMHLPFELLHHEVIHCLTSRQSWRLAPPLTLGDGMCPQ